MASLLIKRKCEMAQMLELASKDLKAAIVNVSKIFMGKTFKELKKSMAF